MTGTPEQVAVSRRIDAPAACVFRLLADPESHVAMDGSGMLRGTDSGPVSGVGDVFVMKMFHGPLGDYEMNNHIVVFEQDRAIAWEPEAGRGHPDAGTADARWGHRWTYELRPDGRDSTVVTETWTGPLDDDGGDWSESMVDTLARLDALCRGAETD